MTQTKVEAPFVANNANFRNLIINGDMQIAQRATSVTGITDSGYKALDRFTAFLSDNGTWTQSKDTDVPSGYGFSSSMKFDCTTADTSVASGSLHLLRHMVEAQNCQVLKTGTSILYNEN